METVTNETGVSPPGGDEPPFEIPLSGKVLGPPDSVRALAAAVGDPFDVTITAAPRYTHLANQVEVRRSWKAVAEQLAKAGVRRADHSSRRGRVGAALREPVQDEIRRLWRTAAELGMPVQTIADLLGVSRQAAYNIRDDKMGGSSYYEHVLPGPREHKNWTDSEIQVLNDLSLTNQECADLLSRSLNGVALKRKRLGLVGADQRKTGVRTRGPLPPIEWPRAAHEAHKKATEQAD